MKQYKITFDRIGRNHMVPPLMVDAVNPVTNEPTTDDDVIFLVRVCADRYLVSSGYSVTCSIEWGQGHIGGGRYGQFTIEEVPSA